MEYLRYRLSWEGVVSPDDIEKVCNLENECCELCEKLAEECDAAGERFCGSDYEIRADEARAKCDKEISEILEKYGKRR